MLISPAEPAVFRQLGKVSSTPEKYGADFMWMSPALGRIGVQRKELHDLIASLGDRLERELLQLKSLDLSMFIIEGRIEWALDGSLILAATSQWTKAQLLAILWGIQYHGCMISFTSSQTETIEYLSLFSRWTQKDRSGTLLTRTKTPAKNVFGTRGDREWAVHILQSFPGIGPEKAAAIYDYYGALPFALTGELTDVPGIGLHLAKKVSGLLNEKPV